MSRLRQSRWALARQRFLRQCGRLALGVGKLQEHARSRPRSYLALLALPTLALGLGLPRLTLDNRLEVWTATEARAVASFEEGDFVALVHPGPAGDPAGFLERDRRLASVARDLPGTREVESVSGVLDRLGSKTLEEIGDAARFCDGYLLTSRREQATVRVWLEHGLRRDSFVQALGGKLAGASLAPAVLGPAAFNAALDERSRAESQRIFPLAALLLGFLLWVLLGSALQALRVLCCSLGAVVWLLGALGWLGIPLNFVSLSAPVILVVAVLSLLLHPVQLLARQEHAAGRTASLSRLSLRTLPGAALSTLTSACGFLTLGAGPSPAVRRFGYLCAAAMPLALAVCLLAVPLLARHRGSPARVAVLLQSGLHRRLRQWGQSLERRSWISFASVTGLVALGVALALRIPVDHQPLDFLARGEPLRVAYEELGPKAGGLAPLELAVELDADPWSPQGLRRLEACVQAALDASAADSCFSLIELVKLAAARLAGGAAGSYALPRDDRVLQAVAIAARTASPEASKLVTEDGRFCRLILPLPLLGGAELQELTRRVVLGIESLPIVSATPRGVVHRLMALQDGILSSQASGLIMGLCGASLLLGAVLGSRRETIAALLTNLLPLSLAAACLSLGQVPLDLSTAMVASISLGISVDDSARFLWTYWRVSRHSTNPAALALEQAGPATVFTGALLAAGFGIIALARFPPIARFGALTAVTLLASVLCHLFVLPALLRRPAITGEVRSTPRKCHELSNVRV